MMIPPFAWGQTPDVVAGEKIQSIEVTGLTRTKKFVVLRELQFGPGDPLSGDSFKEGLQRLRNLQIFSQVEGEIQKGEKGMDVTLRMAERWTTLPILRAVSGGGTTSTIIGLYDINAFGRYIELGGQYENLNGRHSGVVWFRNPRFFGQFLRVGGDFWLLTRNRNLFNNNGKENGAFTLDRERIHLFADQEFHRYFTFGAGIDLQSDEVSDSALESSSIALNAANQFRFGTTQRNNLLQLYSRLGRLNYDLYKVRGFESFVEYDQSLTGLGSDETFSRLQVTNSAFWYLPRNANLGLLLRVGATDTDSIQNLYYLGGLDVIRGYADGQFRAKNFWQANVEYRIPSVERKWIVLQHVLFSDFVAAPIGQDVSTSIGTGIRLISPKVYRLNFRIDIAYGFDLNQGIGVSFGTQQFF
jgi:outer membrane protein assembly factor BamA